MFTPIKSITAATGKTRLASAAAFVDGLRASLRRRELFSWLELEPSRQWHSLVFRGPYDYGGLLASSLPGASAWSGHDTQGPDDFELDPATARAKGASDAAEALDMHWNIASFLPESLREHFEVIVPSSSFAVEARTRRRPRRRRRRWGRRRPEASRPALEDENEDALDEDSPEDDVPVATQHGREAVEASEMRRAAWLGAQVEGYFSQRILRLVGEIQKHLGPGSARAAPQHAFPTPPGAHLSKDLRGGPALAFVKTLCAVLSLDASVEGPVALLRKTPSSSFAFPSTRPRRNSANRASRSSFATPCAAIAASVATSTCAATSAWWRMGDGIAPRAETRTTRSGSRVRSSRTSTNESAPRSSRT